MKWTMDSAKRWVSAKFYEIKQIFTPVLLFVVEKREETCGCQESPAEPGQRFRCSPNNTKSQRTSEIARRRSLVHELILYAVIVQRRRRRQAKAKAKVKSKKKVSVSDVVKVTCSFVSESLSQCLNLDSWF